MVSYYMERSSESVLDNPYSTITDGTSVCPDNAEKNSSNIPLIAGMLLIIAGLMGIFAWVSVLFADQSVIELVISSLNEQGNELNITADMLQLVLTTCSVIGVVLSIVTILGGVMAIKRRLWVVAIIGGILGLLLVGPIFISTMLSLVSLILLILSKKEFNDSLSI
ncbi:MAG: hypothetical protein QXS02_02430 [Candidatus Thermoplasmatota archaeon]